MAWYEDWFDDALYSEVYAHRDTEEASHALDLFESVTGLAPDSRVLDLACGGGRHAAELARRGHRVTAADLSETLLARARSEIRNCQIRPSLVRADMRRLPFTCCFDAVVQLFTAFGYFADDEENERVLRDVAGLLRPGAWYMLDFLNAEEVERNLVPCSEHAVSGGILRQSRRITGGRVEKSIQLERDGETRQFIESVRLFTLEDFQRMFDRTDLTLQAVYGSYAGEPYGPDSKRCIMFARSDR